MSEPKRSEKQRAPWLEISLALIALVGSLGGSWLVARAQAKTSFAQEVLERNTLLDDLQRRANGLDNTLASLERRESILQAIPIGTILPYGGIVDRSIREELYQKGWLVADGRQLAQRDFPALWEAIQHHFNRNAPDGQFTIPDLRGRTLLGSGKAADLSSRRLGDLIGQESYMLNKEQLPGHTHPPMNPDVPFVQWKDAATSGDKGQVAAFQFAGIHTSLFSATGPNREGAPEPYSVMQPSLAVNFLVFFGIPAKGAKPPFYVLQNQDS
jgi:microcystin-dependent protein